MRVGWVGVFAVLAMAAMPGCRLLSRERLISRSMVRSRQFCQQGVAAMERDQWPQAEALLAKAVKTCPEDPDARRFLAESLWQQDRRQEAVEQLEEATRLAGDDSTLHVLVAEMRLALDQTDRARRATRQALDLDPKLSAAWAMRARVMRADGRLRQALSDYHRALGLAPDDRRVLMEIAELYHELNEPQKALATVHTLVDTWPVGEEPQQVLLLEGLAYTELGRYKEATESLAAANLVDHPTPEIFFRLAEAQWLAGHLDGAFEAAKRALRLDPQHRPSLELLQQVDVAGKAHQRLTR